MKIKTFYALYYRHRFIKASILLKLYLLITIVFKYAFNLLFLPKTTNLDIIPSKDKEKLTILLEPETIQLDEYVVTASRRRERIEDAPAAISVISKKEIRSC